MNEESNRVLQYYIIATFVFNLVMGVGRGFGSFLPIIMMNQGLNYSYKIFSDVVNIIIKVIVPVFFWILSYQWSERMDFSSSYQRIIKYIFAGSFLAALILYGLSYIIYSEILVLIVSPFRVLENTSTMIVTGFSAAAYRFFMEKDVYSHHPVYIRPLLLPLGAYAAYRVIIAAIQTSIRRNIMYGSGARNAMGFLAIESITGILLALALYWHLYVHSFNGDIPLQVMNVIRSIVVPSVAAVIAVYAIKLFEPGSRTLLEHAVKLSYTIIRRGLHSFWLYFSIVAYGWMRLS